MREGAAITTRDISLTLVAARECVILPRRRALYPNSHVFAEFPCVLQGTLPLKNMPAGARSATDIGLVEVTTCHAKHRSFRKGWRVE